MHTVLEHMLLIALLHNDETKYAEAQEFARANNLTQAQIDKACNRVTSFLRWHGVKELKPFEKKALVRLQSFFRMIYAKKQLRKRMNYWVKLAEMDDLDHIKKANRICKILNPRKKRKICV